jgi:hypothetical protein
MLNKKTKAFTNSEQNMHLWRIFRPKKTEAKTSMPLIYICFSLAVFFAIIFIGGTGAFAKNLEDIQYPIAELGNCQNEDECELFCEKEENILACIDFAESNGLMNSQEAERARKMTELGITNGPGGCRSEDECEAYCDNPDNMKECLIFAKENGLMPPEELEEAEKVLSALEKGIKLPGGCKGKEECEAYCDDPDHIEECVLFAEAAGFMSPEEAAMVRKTGGKGPGGCQGKDECDSYCEEPEHMEECINFALEYDLMPPEEKDEAMMVLNALKKGVKMPNCRGKEECDIYCSQPENAVECIDFAVAAGFMDSEEAEQVRRMAELGITSGPGGCRSEEECEAFCDNPDNMLICVDFAEQTGMMSHEEAEEARRMAELGITGGPGGCKGEEECKAFCDDPQNMETCIDFSLKAGMMTPEEAEEAKKGLMFIEKCGGPEECMQFCMDNPSDSLCQEMTESLNLKGMMLEQEGMMREGMPSSEGVNPFEGKCSTKEECINFCVEHQEDPACSGAGMMPLESMERSSGEAEMMRQMEMPGMMPGREMMREETERMTEEIFEGNFQPMPEEQAPPSKVIEQQIEQEIRHQIQEEIENEIQRKIEQEVRKEIESQTEQEIQDQPSSFNSLIGKLMAALLEIL